MTLETDAEGNVISITKAKRKPKAKARDVDGSWRDRLTLNDKGGTKSSIGNAILVLTHDSRWQGVVAYDERSEEILLIQRPPFVDCPERLRVFPRAFTDADIGMTAQWLEETYGINVGVDVVHRAIGVVAQNQPIDRVRDYLSGLTWDGVERLDHWLHDYLGTDDSPYTRAVGRRWMISGVARTFAPGCKVDHVIVMEGGQGLRKSSAIEVLAGPDHFGDDIPALGSKDAQQYLGGFWIVELAEMDAASKAEAATLKRFLTTTTDRYRPPYGRSTIVHPRRCIFAGSVNLEEYLKDSTGGRRFWPVLCKAVELEALAKVRDQLWAEAVAAYRAGEKWHLDADLERLAAEQQSKRVEGDPWDEAVASFVARPDLAFVTSAELLEHAVKVEIGRMSKPDRNRVAAIMRRLGWTYGEGTNRKRGWFRPAPTQLPMSHVGSHVGTSSNDNP